MWALDQERVAMRRELERVAQSGFEDRVEEEGLWYFQTSEDGISSVPIVNVDETRYIFGEQMSEGLVRSIDGLLGTGQERNGKSVRWTR